jgi:PilZ domain
VTTQSLHTQPAATRPTLTAVALDVSPGLLATLSDAFARGNVELIPISPKTAQERSQPKAQGCFLPLNARSVRSVAAASSWFVPRQTMLYALGEFEDAVRFARLGINALVTPADGLSLRAAVDTTRNLLSRTFEECSRIPIVVPVRIETHNGALEGLSRNIGCGGIAVRLLRASSLPAQVSVAFELPQGPALVLVGQPRWYSGSLVGFQFRPSTATTTIKRWVLRYAGLACGETGKTSSASLT